MFAKDNVLYSDAYKYLKRKGAPAVAMVVPLTNTSEDDYEEISLPNPLDVVVKGNVVYWGKNLFFLKVKSLRYADIKTAIIKSRYSDDDQMAIILNREKNDTTEMYYQKMQQWREFAAEIARKVSNIE